MGLRDTSRVLEDLSSGRSRSFFFGHFHLIKQSEDRRDRRGSGGQSVKSMDVHEIKNFGHCVTRVLTVFNFQECVLKLPIKYECDVVKR